MKLRVVFLSSAFLFVHWALAFYIGWNGWIYLHSVSGLQGIWIYGSIVALISHSFIIGRIKKSLHFFTIIGSYWMAIIQYALILLPLANLSYWILHVSGFSGHILVKWIGSIVLIIFIVLFSYGTYNAYSPVVKTYTLQIHKPAGKRKNLRIAVASDMHFGTLSGVSHLRRLVRKMKELNPEMILLPGDIIDDDPGPFMRKNMGDVMKELSAPLGVYGVLGNHEYYGGAIPEFLLEMERIGVKMLLDQSVKIDESFTLVGRKDKTDKKRTSMKDLISAIDHSFPIIIMDHQPTEIKQAEQYGADLIISGHTHRGQMAPNHFITRKVFELDWGHLYRNQFHAIVSSGFGFWGPPLRIGSRSEIVQILIHFAD